VEANEAFRRHANPKNRDRRNYGSKPAKAPAPLTPEQGAAVVGYVPKLWDVAGKAASQCGLDPKQLFSVAGEELARAAQRYDPERGVSLWQFAAKAVNGAIKDYVRDTLTQLTGKDAHEVETVSLDEIVVCEDADGVETAKSVGDGIAYDEACDEGYAGPAGISLFLGRNIEEDRRIGALDRKWAKYRLRGVEAAARMDSLSQAIVGAALEDWTSAEAAKRFGVDKETVRCTFATVAKLTRETIKPKSRRTPSIREMLINEGMTLGAASSGTVRDIVLAFELAGVNPKQMSTARGLPPVAPIVRPADALAAA